MGKADTHRDAHLRLFIPRGAYNTYITGDIPKRLVRRRRSLRLKQKKARCDAKEGSGSSKSSEDAAKRAWPEILRTVVIPHL